MCQEDVSETDSHVYVETIFYKGAQITQCGEGKSSDNVGTTTYPTGNIINLDLYFTQHININLKEMNVNVKAKTIKFLKQKKIFATFG